MCHNIEILTDSSEWLLTDTGGDSEQAKQLSKDMRIGLKRAKSELHVDGRPMTAGKTLDISLKRLDCI